MSFFHQLCCPISEQPTHDEKWKREEAADSYGTSHFIFFASKNLEKGLMHKLGPLYPTISTCMKLVMRLRKGNSIYYFHINMAVTTFLILLLKVKFVKTKFVHAP